MAYLSNEGRYIGKGALSEFKCFEKLIRKPVLIPKRDIQER